MSWKKHFRVVNAPGPTLPQPADDRSGHGTSSNFSSYLPEVYAGHPNRIQRYYQYDDMDRDSDVNAALDCIADFATQSEEQNDEPFFIRYHGEANETEVSVVSEALIKWTKLNDFRSRIWFIFRNCIKNGDAFFLRDPETMEWLWQDHFSVEMVKVDDDSGKVPEEYFIRGLDYGKQKKFATRTADPSRYRTPFGTSNVYSSRASMAPAAASANVFSLAGQNRDPRQMRLLGGQANELNAVKAEHVVHLSLSVGMDINWPFGASILEPVFKVYKQKELLEDAIIIYRVQRAPERRIFYIDTGSMPPARAKAHIEQVKNEIHQRRIPNRTGGGASVMDAAYNPLSVLEDYFIAQGADGRGSKVETLSGGELVGEIGDLLFFSKKLARGLRIPPAYLSLGDDEGNIAFSDGKLGQAMIQEYRFNKYCMRLQSLLAPTFDKEFKRFLREQGIAVEPSLFDLEFNEPQNFTKYRQIELDAAQVSVYSQVSENRRLSERWKFKRFLNMTDDEILENERLWAEENPNRVQRKTGSTPAEMAPAGDLSAVGVRPGGPDDFGMDEMPDEGDLDMPPEGGAAGAGAGPAGGGPAPAVGGGGGVSINPAGGGAGPAPV